MNSVVNFCKKEAVLLISLLLAVASMFLVHPDRQYIAYIDFRTLSILFCLMAVMAGLRSLGVFRQIGEMLIAKTSTVRSIALVLILLCFGFSMFITNDVALLTFVPFTVIVLQLSGNTAKLIPIVILETVAANLGSMMMPMGNPQNLYLYSISGLSITEFWKLLLPYGILALLMILLLCFWQIKAEPAGTPEKQVYHRTGRDKLLLICNLILFAVSLLVVARILDERIVFVIVLLYLLCLDRKILADVDYSLLLTFVFLFLFIGNLKRIPAVSELLSSVVVGHEVVTSVLASQVISNVPAALLLSGFTNQIGKLIIGTNLGGLGTLIASMASLISFKQLAQVEGVDKRAYFLQFTIVNVGMLVILCLAAWVL